MHATSGAAPPRDPHMHRQRTMDPRKLLSRRYSLMFLHFGIIIALILVSTLQVRSAILLGIHGTSALMFLIYVPPSAWLTWREGRNGQGYGAKVRKRKKKGKGEKTTAAGGDEERDTGVEEDATAWEDGVRRGWTWDCAGLEVAYLGVQCGGTLVSSVLCALTLSSSTCFGPDYSSSFVLDEFALLKERGTDHWCRGVIGATILSFVQFGLDLAWLGWVVSVVRAGSGVRSGDEGAILRRASIGHTAPDLAMSPSSTITSVGLPRPAQPRPHVHHLFQTLLTPTPRLLAALAERRAAAEAISKERDQPTTDTWQVDPPPILAPQQPHQLGPGASGMGGVTLQSDTMAGDALHAEVAEVPPPYVPPQYVDRAEGSSRRGAPQELSGMEQIKRDILAS